MPECSIRIIGMREAERVAAPYHEKCTQIYTVLEYTFRLYHYETVCIERGTVRSVRAAGGTAPVLSLSIPPLECEDQHVSE